jgi:AraC family transcriptional regulator, transcriptional activator of pobA
MEKEINGSFSFESFEGQAPGPVSTDDSRFTVLWFTRASGSILIDEREFRLCANAVCCLNPWQSFQLLTVANVSGYLLSFGAGFLRRYDEEAGLVLSSSFFSRIFKCPVTYLHGSSQGELLHLAEKMLAEAHGPYAEKTPVLQALLSVFLVQLNRRIDLRDSDYRVPQAVRLTRKFLEQVEQNFVMMKRVSDYARRLSVSANYLNVTVKQVSGASAGQHIRRRVIMEAKRKASIDGLSMKEIAWQLGFEDIAHFSKYFKKGHGVNFSTFKKEIETTAELTFAA